MQVLKSPGVSRFLRLALVFFLTLALQKPAWPQGMRSDYERAGGLRQMVQGKVFKERVEPHWMEGNTRFWYRNDLAGGDREFILVDTEGGTRKSAFDHSRLAAALSKTTGKEVSPSRLSIRSLEYPPEENSVILHTEGKAWICDLRTYELAEVKSSGEAGKTLRREERIRPSRRTGDETTITFVNRSGADVEIFWVDSGGQRRSYGTVRAGEEREQHTFGGHVWLAVDRSGKALAVFEATEDPSTAVIDGSGNVRDLEPRRPRGRRSGRQESPDGKWEAFFQDHNLHLRCLENGETFPLSKDGNAEDEYSRRVFWSPDSKKVVAIRTKKGDDRKVHYVESSPRDQLQPKLHSYDYLKPGDQIPLSKPQLFHVDSRRHIPVSDALFSNPWSVTDLRWDRDSSRFTFIYNQRGHQLLRIVAVNAETGEARALLDETSETFIDYAHKQFARFFDETGELIWMSERDGWNHLYLFDAKTGALKNQITRGEWIVRGVERIDEEKREIWFRAAGIHPGQDPYYIHYCRIGFDGKGLVILTEGDGTHRVQFSPDRRFLIDAWSRVDLPPVTELRRVEDGKLLCQLERADWSELLKTGWKIPERFAAKGRDGETDIYGVIFRPSILDPAKQYPIVEDIYAGPQGSFVPKSFRSLHGSQAIAELGFIVVKIDGMGTSNRSKKFHDVCWKNLGDSGFPDRIPWIRAAAEKYPYMDLTRIGIYGGSAGGQSALRGLLAHGDFYKVAVADCGCHDNRMDKIWWNELWMGWPIGPHYDEQSNVTQAHRLQGKLLLIVGEMDENVDPASTMQVVSALIRADKDFDLLVIPGRGHGAAGTPYGRRRLQDFLVRHLLGVEPRWEPPPPRIRI